MSESINRSGEDFPHINDGSVSLAPRVKMASAQGIVVSLEDYALAVASITAKCMGKESFDYAGNHSHSRPIVFMRHVTWAHMKFGPADHAQPDWAQVGRIAKRDHTTILAGVRSLGCKLDYEPPVLKMFEKITAQVRAEWPSTGIIRQRMKNWVVGL